MRMPIAPENPASGSAVMACYMSKRLIEWGSLIHLYTRATWPFLDGASGSIWPDWPVMPDSVVAAVTAVPWLLSSVVCMLLALYALIVLLADAVKAATGIDSALSDVGAGKTQAGASVLQTVRGTQQAQRSTARPCRTPRLTEVRARRQRMATATVPRWVGHRAFMPRE
jgi:hypothetical protein